MAYKKSILAMRSLFFILLSLVLINTNAQTGLNFQGVARTSNNVILASQAITIKLSILQGSATGTAEYTETRKVTTNAQGLFTAVIGDTGAISTLGNFTTINWKNTPKFLKIEMDPAAGTNFITTGTTQFQYAAYAQFAKSVDAENIVGIVPVTLGGTGVSTIAGLKAALTLNNVNNTADLSKPISTLTQTALDLKANTTDVTTGLATKVDKVTGKELSSNDYTTSEKTKLAAITGTNTGDQTTVSGNAGTATKLSTPRNINGVAFDGTADITVTADAGTLTGTNLKSTVTGSSLTSVGALLNLTVTNPIVGSITGNAATATNATTATTAGNITATNNTTISSLSNLTTVGTITSGTWSATTIALAKGGTGATTKTASFDALSPMTISGDIIYGGTNGSGTRLGKGSNGQILTLASGLPTWANASSGGGVPYTGANQSVDLGAYDLTVNGINIGKGLNNINGNSRFGVNALNANGLSGGFNTAIGGYTLYSNLNGHTNVALGNYSLFNNLSGQSNVALGNYSLYENISGTSNVAVGIQSLERNTTGGSNTSIGLSSMYYNTIGSSNVAIGSGALTTNLSGGYNVAIGVSALATNINGNNNTAIGSGADVISNSLTNATAIGKGAIVTSSNTIQLGNSSVTGIRTSGTLTAGAVTYPNLDGTTNQVLLTNGSGVLSFGAIPTLNQNTTGNAATVTTNANLTGPVTSVGNATAIANGSITNAMLANGAVANLSGTNTGDQTTITGNAGTVTNGVYTVGDQTIAGAKTFSSTIVGSVSGNAGTATKLSTPRNINGVAFDGSTDITVTADAGILTGTTNVNKRNVNIFSTTGTHSWTAPQGVTSIKVELWGGAGGGGGQGGRIDGSGLNTTAYSGGLGGYGGYGGYNMSMENVVPGNTYQIIVGSGGLAGNVGSNGNTTNFINVGGTGETGQTGGGGQSSSFNNIITAQGGFGGIGGTGIAGIYVSSCGFCAAMSGTNGANGSDGSIINYIYTYNSLTAIRSYIPTEYLPPYPAAKASRGQPGSAGEDGIVLIIY